MPQSWLRRLFSRTGGTIRKAPPTAKLQCQILEGRTVPYNIGGRWTQTATNAGPIPRGDAITLTWGFVADGTQTGSGASDLIAAVDARYGAGPGGPDLTQRPWFPVFQQAFNRWGQLAGLTYVYEPNDDGAAFPSSKGVLGVRPDVRLSGVPQDGPFNVLAFNYFPNQGDMVIDTDEFRAGGAFTNTSNNYRLLRNMLGHEHGHGLGFDHEVPPIGAALMEPFLSTNFDGPQIDDIQAAQRNYGDVLEKNGGNNTTATATPLAALPANGSVSMGTSVGATQLVGGAATDFLSIDGTSDTDVFSLTATVGTRLSIKVTPVGPTYQTGQQGGAAAVSFDASSQSDLSFQVLNSAGAVVATVNAGGLGVAESLPAFDTPLGGNYFLKITGAQDKLQLYKLDVASALVSPTTTITKNPGQPAVTNGTTIRFDVKFSLPVAGFAAGQVQFTAGTLSAGLSATVTPNGTTGDWYFVDVTGMNGTGTVGIALPLGAGTTTGGGQSLPATTPVSDLVTFDNVAPSPAFLPGSIGLTNRPATPVTVTFTEPVQGFTAAGLATTNATVQNFTQVAPDTYTFTLQAAADGNFSVTVTAGAASDPAGNTILGGTIFGTLDATPPVATITRVSPTTIPVEPAVFLVSFSEPLLAGSFAASDVLFTGSTTAGTLAAQVTPVTGSPTDYTVSVTGMTSVGTIRVSIGTNAVVDQATNFNTDPAVTTEDVQLVGAPPVVALSTPTAFPTNAASVPVTAVFSARVNGFTVSDVSVLNGTVSNFVAKPDGKTFTFDVLRGPDGPFKVSIPAGAAVSNLGIPNDPGSLSGTFDATPPLASLTTVATFPTRQASVPVTVRFSEVVAGFTAADLSVTGPAAVANFQAAGDNRTFTFTVTRTGDGAFSVTAAVGGATDAAGNLSVAAGLAGSFDTTGPTPTVTTAATFPTNATDIPVTVAFPEAVTGFAADDVVLVNASLTNFQASADGQTFTFSLARGNDGLFSVSVPASAATDRAGNANLGASLGGTFDATGPTTSAATPLTFPTNNPVVPVTVTFSEPVIGFTAADLVPVNVTVSNFFAAADGKTFTFDLNRTADGAFTLTVPGGAATDAAGNPTAVAGLSGSFDTVGLSTTLDPTASAFFATAATFTVRFDQAPAAPLTAAGVQVGGSAAPTAVTVTPVGDGRTFTLTVTGMTQDGTVTARVLPGAVTDPAGNPSAISDPAQALFSTRPVVAPVPPPDAGLVGARQFAAGVGAGGSPLVSLVGPDGRTLLQRPAFDPGFTGGVRTASADLNGDGIAEVVVGTGPGGVTQVNVLNGATGASLFSIQPFEAAFTGGVYVTTGDMTGDGTPDFVVTPDEGGGPRVLVYDGKTFALVGNFFGIDDPNFRGGARAAAGDFNGDGRADLVVAAGFGGGPRVAVYDGTTVVGGPKPTRLFNDIFVFEQTLRNGAFVTAGDLDGDGRADLIVGGGPGGAPRVTVYSGSSLYAGDLAAPTVLANFFAGTTSNRGGVRVAAKDLDGDNKADIVTGDGEGAGTRISGYLGSALLSGSVAPSFSEDAFPGFTGGVYVG